MDDSTVTNKPDAKRKSRRRYLIPALLLLLVAIPVGLGSAALFFSRTTNGVTFSNGTMTMSNVAGSVVSGANCTSVKDSACAVIFNVSNERPAAATPVDSSNTVTITYTGSLTTGDFRLYIANLVTKAGASTAECTASDPASLIDLQIKDGATQIFPLSGTYGTLSGFAASYNSSANGLPLNSGVNGAGSNQTWANGDHSAYTINLHLDNSADNTYQGCASTATLTFYAPQAP